VGSSAVFAHSGIGPLAAALLLLALVAALRWTFSVRSRDSRLARARAMRDFGLLVPVATVTDTRAAEARRALLEAHGVRATVAPAVGPDHGERVRVSARGEVAPRQAGRTGVHVLVFPADEAQARELLSHLP
jgi:hypothetical protein